MLIEKTKLNYIESSKDIRIKNIIYNSEFRYGR